MNRPFAAAALVVMLAGCATPSPAPVLLALPPTDSSLPAPPAAVASTPGATDTGAPRLLAIRRIGIPEYLVARRVRYRSDASTLAEWPNTFWAERIEIGVSREFVSALRQQLPGWAICDATCGDALPTVALQVDLVPMDYVRSRQVLQARARITVSSAGAAPRVLHTRELGYELPVTADTAQGHAQAVSALLRQVAGATAPLITAAPP